MTRHQRLFYLNFYQQNKNEYNIINPHTLIKVTEDSKRMTVYHVYTHQRILSPSLSYHHFSYLRSKSYGRQVVIVDSLSRLCVVFRTVNSIIYILFIPNPNPGLLPQSKGIPYLYSPSCHPRTGSIILSEFPFTYNSSVGFYI